MKIFHTLPLIAALALGTAAFAKSAKQDMGSKSWQSDSMDDQDYSAWKDYFFGMKRGNMMSMNSNSGMKPMFTGAYDEQVFKYVKRLFWADESIPVRPFDGLLVQNFRPDADTRWMEYEKKANMYRRELIRDNMKRMEMMGK